MDTCERRTRDAEASASSAPLRSDRTGDVVKNMSRYVATASRSFDDYNDLHK